MILIPDGKFTGAASWGALGPVYDNAVSRPVVGLAFGRQCEKAGYKPGVIFEAVVQLPRARLLVHKMALFDADADHVRGHAVDGQDKRDFARAGEGAGDVEVLAEAVVLKLPALKAAAR